MTYPIFSSVTKYLLTFSRFGTLRFTTSETELDYNHQKVNIRLASTDTERLKM